MARNKNKGKGKNKGGGGGNKNKGKGGGNNNRGSSSNKGSSGGGSKPSQSSSSPSRRQQAKAAASMSTQQRRAAAKEAGVGLKDFKAGRTGANAVARRDAQRAANRPGQGNQQGQQQQTQGNTFTTAAGYQMKSGSYNARSKEMYEQYKKDNPKAGMSILAPDNASFDKDGYLSYDSTKPQWQANNMLKEAGYKAGDMLWKPGALDDLNGRKLTGRIARITELGNYIPEYEHDAVNSNHQGTGNRGYGGKVGLGADQYAYNREYERNNDVTTGQRNQQLEINGFETKTEINDVSKTQGLNQQSSAGLNDGMNENNNGFTNDYGNGFSTPPQMRLSNASTAEQAANPSFAQYDFSGNGAFSKKRTLSSGMNFSFNPGKFMQGQ